MTADQVGLLFDLFDLERDGLKWRMRCPACEEGTATITQLSETLFEVVCTTRGCGEGPIRKAASAALRAANGATSNGTHPTESASELGTSVVFVGTQQHEIDVSPPSILADEALHGVAGDVVRLIEPHTESAPVALLLTLLITVGNMIGRRPHYPIEGARHGTGLFGVLVGTSGNSRKGTGSRRVYELLRSININYTKTNCMHGLSSGEGLVHAVRDARIEQVPVKKAGRHTGEYDEVIVDQGVADKRAMILEEEFASVLKVAAREGNTLTARIREAWDGRTLGTMTKNSREFATDPHISVLGHITDVELRRYLTATEAGNGLANRFLWICTQRSKLLPRGGGKPNTAPLVSELHQRIEYASCLDEFEFDQSAGELWDHLYGGLSASGGGLFGSVTNRAEAQTLRLSVTYAALDCLPVIEVDHLLAAIALWDFAEASCRYLFGTATGDESADLIEERLQEVYPGAMSRTELRDAFGRNLPAGRLGKALAALSELGRAERKTVPTGGRPTEYWTAILSQGVTTKHDKRSHLVRAKEFLANR
jgi:hypothetical protein